MSTYDQMLVDNRYTGDFDNNTFSYSQPPAAQQDVSNQNGNDTFGQTGYLGAAAHDQKEDENMYRYVSSRLTDRSSPPIGKTASVHAGSTKSPYSVESGKPGANNNQPRMPYGQGSKPVSSHAQPSNTSTTMPGIDPRQDSLLGPLLAELDSLANQPLPQQGPSSHAPSIHSQSSVSYQSNRGQPNGPTYPNHDPRQQQQQPSHSLNMGGTDIFMPSSNAAAPGSYYNQYDPDDQLFQSSSHQPNATFDRTHAGLPPGPPLFRQQNTNPFINHHTLSSEQNPSNNEQLFSTNHNGNRRQQAQHANQQPNPANQQQAIWNKFQNNGAKGQEKTAKKLELPGRGKGTIGSSMTSTSYGAQHSSTVSQSPRSLSHHSPSHAKLNHIENNIHMIKHKENYYHRYPARKYENMYAKRKDLSGGNDYGHNKHEQDSQIQSSNNFSQQGNLPVTINLNTGDNSHNGSIPATVNIPLDSHMNHGGENLSVDINLRLVDGESPQQQQQQEQQRSDHPNWTGADALERHIRKMERSVNQHLPVTHHPQRSPILLTTGNNPSTSRLEKTTSGMGYSGYHLLNHGKDHYSYSDKGREENSYLAKMKYSKGHSDFKPYTGGDYERFKKNCGFGTGHLGFDSENTTFKEKMEKAAKMKEYAQQIEVKNKKSITDASNRASSETRLTAEETKTLRLFEHPPLSKRTMHFTSKPTHSSPVSMTEIVSLAPARRQTDALYRLPPAHRTTEVVHQPPPPPARRSVEVVSRSPPTRRPIGVATQSPPARRLVEVLSQPSPAPRQRIRFPQHEDYEVVENIDRYEERDVTPVKRLVNPPKKRREQNDENDSRRSSSIDSYSPVRTSLRRISPTKLSPPRSRINSDNSSKRRPLRFDSFPPSDDPPHPSPPHSHHSIQQHKRKSSVDQLDNPQLDDESLMKVIRDELNERPLQDGEELVVVD